MKQAGWGGRAAMNIASIFAPHYVGRRDLSRFHPRGYIDPSVTLDHSLLKFGLNCFLGQDIIIYRDTDGGPVTLEDRVHLYGDSAFRTGESGTIHLGADCHVQSRCEFSAYKAPIIIGSGAQIASCCAFYPYSHGTKYGIPMQEQPLVSKGGIVVGDDVWLGYGVVVLDGTKIGNGTIIGAGSVVRGDIPDNCFAAGVPAKVLKFRG